MDSLAAAVGDMEGSLVAQDLEDLRQHSESMHKGQATTKETHANLREKERRRKNVTVKRRLRPTPSLSTHPGPHTSRKTLTTRCFDCKRFGHRAGDQICSEKRTHSGR